MARAFITIEQSFNRGGYDELEFLLGINFYGNEVANDQSSAGPFIMASGPIAGSNSAVQIQNAIAAVGIAKAASLGLTVANGDTLICGLTKV